MPVPVQIAVHNLHLPEDVRAELERKAEKLGLFYDGMQKLRVVVDLPHRHSHEGMRYEVRIDMVVPGNEIVIRKQADEDIHVAVRDAFDAAARKLEDYVRVHRGKEKRHEEMPQGRISSLFIDKGYGFVVTPEGTVVYFHENSVMNRELSSLCEGMAVRFSVEEGEKGPQASTLWVME